MPAPHSNGESKTLSRRLGLFDSTMMMVGIVIGSGIFLTTGIMANSIPSAGLILLAWVVGGILTLAGALTFAELGAAMPEAGGQYVYLREAYGHWAGFLFGWILFLVAMGGSIAALAVGFSEYFGYFFPVLSPGNVLASVQLGTFSLSFSAGQIVAVGMILLLSIINYIGVGLGKGLQNFVTIIKIGTIILFVLLGFIIGKGGGSGFSTLPSTPSGGFGTIFVGFGVALVAVSWAFDGWHNINYVAGEIKNPKRNLPLTLILGTLIITGLYVLMNIVYLKAMPVNEMKGMVRIAEGASTALFGSTTAALVSVAVLISTFGALHGAIFVGPRVYFAMARDGLFFKNVGKVHPRFQTPSVAIVIQAVWASILTLSGTYEQLFTYVIFITIAFWMAGMASVFRLRKTQPDLPRPYKTWGYPAVPIIFLVMAGGIMLNTLIQRPVESLAGVILTALGFPVYWYWRRRKSS